MQEKINISEYTNQKSLTAALSRRTFYNDANNSLSLLFNTVATCHMYLVST